jgi:hypothetical protein
MITPALNFLEVSTEDPLESEEMGEPVASVPEGRALS